MTNVKDFNLNTSMGFSQLKKNLEYIDVSRDVAGGERTQG